MTKINFNKEIKLCLNNIDTCEESKYILELCDPMVVDVINPYPKKSIALKIPKRVYVRQYDTVFEIDEYLCTQI